MPKVVLDASSLIGALLKAGSIPEQALLIARSFWTICLSDSVEAEVRAVFARPKFISYVAAGRGRLVLATLTAAACRYEPLERVSDCRDMKDNKYLELALAAGASVIVSSDDDLLVLSPWRGIRILTPAMFVHEQRSDVPSGPSAGWGRDATVDDPASS